MRQGDGAVGAQMALYRGVWRTFCIVFVVLGVVAAGLLLPVDILEVALVVAPVAGATAAVMYGSTGKTNRWTRRQVALAAATAAAITTLALGLSGVLGPSVLWLVVLLGATSPPAVQWYYGRMRFGQVGGHLDVPGRTTPELCRQWQDSYEALRRAKNDVQRLRIVMERQQCLDELDRRDPEALQAWLGSAASAAGDPARFFRSQ